MLIVKKFGGTSVRLLDNILNIISNELARGNKVIVVVSALSGITDILLSDFKSRFDDIRATEGELIDEILREKRALLSCGEIASAALLASSLISKGYRACSLASWQSGIWIDQDRNNANIESIDKSNISALLEAGIIPVIAGFQGINKKDQSINILPRGGSDYTAVAIAHAFDADRCDIYTDVDGFYDSDPNKNFNATHIERLDYKHLLLSSLSGNKVVQYSASALAMAKNINLFIKSTTDDSKNSQICNFEDSFNKVFSISINYEAKVIMISPNKNLSAEEICEKYIANSYLCGELIRFFATSSGVFLFTKDEGVIRRCNFFQNKGLRHKTIEDICMLSIATSNPSATFEVYNIVAREARILSLRLQFLNCSQGLLSFFLKKEYAQSFANKIKALIKSSIFLEKENSN